MFKEEGSRSFMKGINPTLINNTKLALQMPMYDYMKEHTNSVTISSMGSKLASSTIFYPLDIIRTNMRASQKPLGIGETVRNIYTRHGYKGFYKGVGLYNLISGPNFVLMMIIRDYLKKMV